MPSSETPSDPFIARNVPHSWTTMSVRLPDAEPVQAAALMVRTVAIRTRSFTAVPPRNPQQRAAVSLGRRAGRISSVLVGGRWYVEVTRNNVFAIGVEQIAVESALHRRELPSLAASIGHPDRQVAAGIASQMHSNARAGTSGPGFPELSANIILEPVKDADGFRAGCPDGVVEQHRDVGLGNGDTASQGHRDDDCKNP